LERLGLRFGEFMPGFTLGNDDIVLHLPGQNPLSSLNAGQITRLIMLNCTPYKFSFKTLNWGCSVAGIRLSTSALTQAEIETQILTSQTHEEQNEIFLLPLFISHTQY